MKWFCNHDWTRWSPVMYQEVSASTSTKIQVRSCVKCGTVKFKRVWGSSYIAPVTLNYKEEK
jgi:hypothetical protein